MNAETKARQSVDKLLALVNEMGEIQNEASVHDPHYNNHFWNAFAYVRGCVYEGIDGFRNRVKP